MVSTMKNSRGSTRRLGLLYTRVSSRKQVSDGSGLSSQEYSCRKFAEDNDIEILATFSDTLSGKSLHRTGMSELIRYVQENPDKNLHVIVDNIDRFARDVSAHLTLKEQLTALGVELLSPNTEFGTDPHSNFMEIVKAGIAQLDRETNAQRAKLRSKARMEAGYYTLATPLGYRYQKSQGEGKILVRNDPDATAVEQAIKGFVTNRFKTIADVKRFFDGIPEFRSNARRKEIKIDTVKSILLNPLYAGYIIMEPWGIPLTPARHQPLVSFEVHKAAKEKILEKPVVRSRFNIEKDFPLRGFVECSHCGTRLTSCWSRSRTGTRYPYYLCQKKGVALEANQPPGQS